MDRDDWLTLIIRASNQLIKEHEPKLQAAMDADGSLESVGGIVDSHVRSVLIDAYDPWDLVRFSNLRDPSPSLWKDADQWGSVVLAVAFACFSHDVARNAEMILKGDLPRMDPDKIVYTPKDDA